MNFASFQASEPAKAMFRKLGLSDFLEAAQSWRSLRKSIIYFNDPDKGRFVALARQCDGVASSGERVLLHAILFATDFAWLADELTDGRAWRRMDRADEQHLQAVAACILSVDEPSKTMPTDWGKVEFMTTEEIVRGLNEIDAGDKANIVKAAVARLEEMVRTIDRLRATD